MAYPINKAKLWSNGTGVHYSGVESNGHSNVYSNGINHHNNSYSNGKLEFDTEMQNTHIVKRILFLERENTLLKGNLKEKEAMIEIYKKRLDLLEKDHVNLRKKKYSAVKNNNDMIFGDIKTE